MNVLSIDFDAFYNLSYDYRDDQQCDIDWSITYVENEDVFTPDTCKFYYKEFEKVKSIIENANCPIYVSEDHSIVADVLNNIYTNKEFNIINIDYHTDMVRHPPFTLNCANWLTWLNNKQNIEHVTWVSFKDYPNILKQDYLELHNNFIIKSISARSSLEEVDFEDIDIIFIVQSYMWSPPHMYHKFRELLSVAKDFIIDESFPLLQLTYSESIKRMCELEKLDYCFSTEEADYYLKTEELEDYSNEIETCIIKFPRDIRPVIEKCFGTGIDTNYCDILDKGDVLFMYVELRDENLDKDLYNFLIKNHLNHALIFSTTFQIDYSYLKWLNKLGLNVIFCKDGFYFKYF